MTCLHIELTERLGSIAHVGEPHTTADQGGRKTFYRRSMKHLTDRGELATCYFCPPHAPEEPA